MYSVTKIINPKAIYPTWLVNSANQRDDDKANGLKTFKVYSLLHPQLNKENLATFEILACVPAPWIVAHQAALSMRVLQARILE